MKVVIATGTLSLQGGATFLVEWLQQELIERGHDAKLLRIPAPNIWNQMPAGQVAYSFLTPPKCDVLIACRMPAHSMRHEHKNLWFWHHQRGVFDLMGTKFQEAPPGPLGLAWQKVFYDLDMEAFATSANIFTNSQIVSDRVMQINNLASEVVYPPVRHPERFQNLGYGDEILYVSRVNTIKRQDLLIKALAYTRTPVRVCIMGRPENDNGESLKTLVKELGVENKVSFELGWVSEEEKVKRIGSSLAVAYIPFDEDSYGFPTLEGAHAQKAALVTTDGGGVSELVQHGRNGLIVPPDPVALGAAMDRLWEDREYAAWMGANAAIRVQELQISWDSVTKALLR